MTLRMNAQAKAKPEDLQGSKLEVRLALQLRARKYPEWEREHRFDPDRQWRLDFAWPERKVAIEVHGGTYKQGRHTRGTGFCNDRRKMNRAALLGWTVLEGDAKMVDTHELANAVGELL